MICFVRAFYLQVVRHEHHSDAKKRMSTAFIEVREPRGDILDQRGYPLAMSIRSFSSCVYPKMIKDDVDIKEASRRIARILRYDTKVIEKKLLSQSHFQWLKRILSSYEEKRLRKLAEEYEFIDFVPEFKRRYPGSKSFSHLLGYTGVDDQGLAGIELSCNQWLEGQKYRITMKRDNRGNRILPQTDETAVASRKKNIVLTVDSVIQTYAEDAVQCMIEKFRPKAAVGMVMNVHNGDILAMVSFPRFDNNRYQEFNLETMRNLAVSSNYEPGSTFKAITFSAVMEEGMFQESEIIDCGPGIARVGPRMLRDSHPCGVISAEQVFVQSSNVGSAKLAYKIGDKKFYEHIKLFGFGEQTGISIKGEEAGIFHPLHKWTSYSMTSLPMGQEISVTPIQILTAYCALANGGRLVKPRILQRVELDDGSVIQNWEPQTVRRVISEETSARMKRLLGMVVEEGTGKSAKSELYTIGGKTGTSQKNINGRYSDTKHIGSFVAIAPVENPKIAVMVALDDPIGKGYGGQVAAPAVKSIIENTLLYLNVQPSKVSLAELVEEGLEP